MVIGDTVDLTVSVVPSSANDKIMWKSLSSNIVQVSEDGELKAIDEGKARYSVLLETLALTIMVLTKMTALAVLPMVVVFFVVFSIINRIMTNILYNSNN